MSVLDIIDHPLRGGKKKPLVLKTTTSVAFLLTLMTQKAEDTGQEEAQWKRSKMATGLDHGLKRVVWQSKLILLSGIFFVFSCKTLSMSPCTCDGFCSCSRLFRGTLAHGAPVIEVWLHSFLQRKFVKSTWGGWGESRQHPDTLVIKTGHRHSLLLVVLLAGAAAVKSLCAPPGAPPRCPPAKTSISLWFYQCNN